MGCLSLPRGLIFCMSSHDLSKAVKKLYRICCYFMELHTASAFPGAQTRPRRVRSKWGGPSGSVYENKAGRRPSIVCFARSSAPFSPSNTWREEAASAAGISILRWTLAAANQLRRAHVGTPLRARRGSSVQWTAEELDSTCLREEMIWKPVKHTRLGAVVVQQNRPAAINDKFCCDSALTLRRHAVRGWMQSCRLAGRQIDA